MTKMNVHVSCKDKQISNNKHTEYTHQEINLEDMSL